MKTLLSLAQIRPIYKLIKETQALAKKEYINLNMIYGINFTSIVQVIKNTAYRHGVTAYHCNTTPQAQKAMITTATQFITQKKDFIQSLINGKIKLTLSEYKEIYKLFVKNEQLRDQIVELRPHMSIKKYTFKGIMADAYTTRTTYDRLIVKLQNNIDNLRYYLTDIEREERKKAKEAKEALIRMQTPLNGYNFTIAQIRLINQKTNLGNYSLKEFITICLDRDIDDIYKVLEVIESLNNGYLTIETLEDNEYFYHEDRYYDNEEYCLTLEGDICDRDNCSWCHESEEYTSDPVTLRDGRHEHTIARSVAREHYYVCAWDDDIYYSQDGIEYYGYYANDDNEVTDEPPSDEYVREYHSNTSTKYLIFDDNNLYRIGFEIEKEDNYIKESIDIDSFEYETDNKWRKEEDGSLSDYSGFELVSPCFSLDPEAIREYIEDNDTLIDHINANYSDNCGGHINLSKKGLTGEEFYETIKGYTPLIHALNYDRLNESYCTPASVNKLKADKRKFQSIAIWDNRIELRIFSAVENVDQLIWRAELMKLVCDNPTDCFKTAFYNVHTVLKQHLEEGYNNEYFNSDNHYDDYQDFINEIIAQCKKYENIDLV